MKIEYRTPAGSGSYSILADESVATLAAAISGFQPVVNKSPMVEAGYGAAVPVTLDLGNANYRASFTVERVHASPDAALLFVQAEPLKFSGNVDLKITQGAQVTLLLGGALTELTPEPHSDQSTKIRYAFAGGQYTTP